MQRAAILIGVSKTEGLPELQAVEAGIAQMLAWAAAQHIDGDRLVVLTDKRDKVRAHQVADAVDRLVKRRDLDQLIVYFSGHGLYNRGDIWLLSDAPRLAGEAINVEGSIQAARTCGVTHVVIISDACRTAPEGIQALNIQGIEIFPNEPVDGKERPVDVYFACARGKPALEVRDAAEAARFSGIYTEVLAECLLGKHPDALELSEEDGVEVAKVLAWPLADKLLAEVPMRLKARLGRNPTVNQTPVARITSRAAWVSRLSGARPQLQTQEEVEVLGGAAGVHLNAVDAADQLLRAVFYGHADLLDSGLLGDGDAAQDAGGGVLLSTAIDLSTPPRPLTTPIRCGFRLRGARVHALHGGAARCTIADANARVVEAEPASGPVVALLELDDGGSVLLPAIPGFIAELRFKDGELAHLAWEPVAPVPADAPGDEYASQRSAARAALGSVAAAAGLGVLRPGGVSDFYLYRALRGRHWPLDLSLALYAAYAWHDAGRRSRIGWLRDTLRKEIGFTFYDLALLGGRGSLQRARGMGEVLPAVPLLSRGWSLLKVFGADLPPLLEELQACLRPSVWTLFNSAGTNTLVKAIEDGRMPI
jgi:hypothetical protein